MATRPHRRYYSHTLSFLIRYRIIIEQPANVSSTVVFYVLFASFRISSFFLLSFLLLLLLSFVFLVLTSRFDLHQLRLSHSCGGGAN